MRMKDLEKMDGYSGEVFQMPKGMRRRYQGVCNGPMSLYVGSMLYGYCAGGDFDFEVYAASDCDVSIRVAKGVEVSLSFPKGPHIIVGDAAASWTRDEPRPAVNPQMAAIQAQLGQMQHRLAQAEYARQQLVQRALAAAEVAVTTAPLTDDERDDLTEEPE